MAKPVLIANWKMNKTQADVYDFFDAMKSFSGWDEIAEWVICPPSLYLNSCFEPCGLFNISLGGQDVSAYEEGAYTGDVSATMLHNLGCTFVIIGHSERRHYVGESTELCMEKIQQALRVELTPVYCIGESFEQRQEGRWKQCLLEQLSPLLSMPEKSVGKCMIAYEPVWAIGTGQAATLQQIEEVHAFIRSLINESHQTLAKTTKILYGGSVKPESARALFAAQGVDGFLIGGASLEVDSFYNIGVACSHSC